MMDLLQNILAYCAFVFALGYLLKKFVLPKRWFRSKAVKKVSGNGCGDNNCGCH